MSTSTARIHLSEAICEANAFRDLFAGTFEQWTIAGSVRRKRPDIGDIEHVIIPKVSAGSDLLGETNERFSLVRERAEELMKRGVVAKQVYSDGRTRYGEKYMGFRFHGRQHEVFCAGPDNWGCILAIRTGPADFSRMLVTELLKHGHKQFNGRLCTTHQGVAQAIDCPDEETFFRAAGLAYVEPEMRA